MSSIVTFYSYKGGVGRSMALANIAVLLSRRGLKVLAVDWDLEAPGLERYFSYYEITGRGTGLLRMLVEARDMGEIDENAFTLSVQCGGSHPLTLLPSGREQDDAYSANLESFDWGKFFAHGGGVLFEELRNRWRSEYDIVLIDSRTGLSDTGGICTIQLPDVVVAMFTANHQSLYGVRDVMRLAQRARQSLAYDRMPLSILPLPSRWGVQEFQETQVWLDRVVEGVREFYADWLPVSIDPRQVVETIKIPHHSYFGFGERLAVQEQGTSDPTGMGFVYDKVAAFLASDLRDVRTLTGIDPAVPETARPPIVRKRHSQRSVFREAPRREDVFEYDVFVSHDRSSTEAAIEIADALKRELSSMRGEETRLYLDVSEVVAGDHWRDEIRDAVSRSKIMLMLVTPRYFESDFAVKELNQFLERSSVQDEALVLPVLLAGDPLRLSKLVGEHVIIDAREAALLRTSKSASGRRPSSWHATIHLIANLLREMIDEAPSRPAQQTLA
ncbi:TIR domain-containing protein [Bradyrhizobium ontarionense]|uniref:TIR domain-containing protein n=1 Tax=Bradyrhizobium ontarionense TaxID=2898149 RepID=A0ABY3RLB3_9BRAD|nr:TIR domain-containing protein [Bradyrhizobium sp. A19]UFZ07662.1 TIR domain-containing protein [Bradyrhizobium sp. A19]